MPYTSNQGFGFSSKQALRQKSLAGFNCNRKKLSPRALKEPYRIFSITNHADYADPGENNCVRQNWKFRDEMLQHHLHFWPGCAYANVKYVEKKRVLTSGRQVCFRRCYFVLFDICYIIWRWQLIIISRSQRLISVPKDIAHAISMNQSHYMIFPIIFYGW